MLTFVTGGASVVAFIGLALIVLMTIMKKQLKGKVSIIMHYVDKERMKHKVIIMQLSHNHIR